jgi:hypothetical protein
MTSILPLDLPVYWKVQDTGVMQPAIEANTERETTRDSIGPAGTAARVAVGITLIALALFWWTPTLLDFILGLVVLPGVAIGLFAWRARRHPAHLNATGPAGHLANAMVFAPMLIVPATAGGALLFYGSSMLMAAARRSGGCEVTVIANAALRRDDQIGCVLFAPIDLTERAINRDKRGAPR